MVVIVFHYFLYTPFFVPENFSPILIFLYYFSDVGNLKFFSDTNLFILVFRRRKFSPKSIFFYSFSDLQFFFSIFQLVTFSTTSIFLLRYFSPAPFFQLKDISTIPNFYPIFPPKNIFSVTFSTTVLWCVILLNFPAWNFFSASVCLRPFSDL